MMHVSRSATVLVVLSAGMIGVLGPLATAGAQVTFQDSTFADLDWTLEVFFVGGSGGTASAEQALGGGNPGSHRQVTHNLGSRPAQVAVFHQRSGAAYDPQVQGPISGVDFSFDAKTFADDGYGGQSSSLGIRQGGVVYTGPGFANGESVWQGFFQTGVAAGAFTDWNGSAHPDFSGSGGIMHFGLVTSNTNPPGGIIGPSSTTVGYDNWSVAIATTSGVGEGLLPNSRETGAVPNPFGRQTTLRFALERSETVSFRVFDSSGRVIREISLLELTPGPHSVSWDGLDSAFRRAPAGMYFYRIATDSWTATGRMMFVH
jgi:hypothetical protein